MKSSIKYAFLTCTLGYVLIVAISTVTILIISKMITGYYLHLTTILELITFNLIYIHQGFFIVPLAVAICTMALLLKFSQNKKLIAGLSMTSYYLIVALIYAIMGAREFPLEILILWLPWVFMLGFASSIIVDKFHAWYSGGTP
jgi:hypothetical protein